MLEFYGGMIALKTKEGKYLSPFAGKGVLKDSRKVATRVRKKEEKTFCFRLSYFSRTIQLVASFARCLMIFL